MQQQHPHHGDSHIEAHIDLCPDHSFHLKVGNVCLHLCQEDFLQLAHAIARAAEQLPPADVMSETEKSNLH